MVSGDPNSPWSAPVPVGLLKPRVRWNRDVEGLADNLLDRGPARHQPRTKHQAVGKFRICAQWNFNLAGEAAPSQMAAFGENMDVKRFVA